MKDLVHYIKSILQVNDFGTSILSMGVNDVLKLGSNIHTVSKDIINTKYYKPSQKFWCETNHYFWFDTY